jgi:hypothetical protein
MTLSAILLELATPILPIPPTQLGVMNKITRIPLTTFVHEITTHAPQKLLLTISLVAATVALIVTLVVVTIVMLVVTLVVTTLTVSAPIFITTTLVFATTVSVTTFAPTVSATTTVSAPFHFIITIPYSFTFK